MIGGIGFGNMGHAIASSLLKAGYALTVYNHTTSKAEALLAKGAQLAQSGVHEIDLFKIVGYSIAG